MDLSFATDPKAYSEAAESLRAEKKELTEDNLRKRYEEIKNRKQLPVEDTGAKGLKGKKSAEKKGKK